MLLFIYNRGFGQIEPLFFAQCVSFLLQAGWKKEKQPSLLVKKCTFFLNVKFKNHYLVMFAIVMLFQSHFITFEKYVAGCPTSLKSSCSLFRL